MTDILPVPRSEEQPLGAVLDILRLERDGENSFRGRSLPTLSGRIYGGQVLAQCLTAAGATLVEDDGGPRVLHSTHAYFMRAGDLEEPIEFTVERLHDGRSFSARRVHALQFGRPILSLMASFQEVQPGLSHAVTAPDVPAPEDLPSALELFASIDNPAANFMSDNYAFDIRHVDGHVYVRAPEHRTEHQALWIRLRSPMPEGDGTLLHQAMLAYQCDQVILEPVLRRQGLTWVTPGLHIASLDHAMWWHRPVRVDDWLLYVQESPTAQGARGLGLAKVFDRGGALVATIAQEGMIRVPAEVMAAL